MKSPINRKIARFLYYVRNIARDIAPQFVFRQRLPAILGSADKYDAAYLSWRLNYYNKLDRPVPIPSNASTVASIPMAGSLYYYDLKEHARYFPRHLRIAHRFGDVTFVPDFATIVKSRPVAANNQNSVLFNLDKFRHFYFPADRTPFVDKKPLAVWRGGGHNPRRRRLLARYRDHPLCDIGQTHGTMDRKMRKAFLTPTEQMRFRYVISIEGNDVATNLKWILASNSLCFMTKPTCETWFMESRLEAGQHYVRLNDDFEDLEEKILFYERHPGDALAIIRKANEHVAQFQDDQREQLLALLVLYKYFIRTGQIEPDHRLMELIGHVDTS
jgi:hypothetical protein